MNWYKKSQEAPKLITVYHASHLGNVPNILKEGIKPRDNQFYFDLLSRLQQEYNIPDLNDPNLKPKWVVKQIHEEISYAYKSRQGYVSLSGNPEYATGNALAGFEVEENLRYLFEMLSKKRSLHRKDTMGKIKEKMPHKDNQIALFEIELPESELRPDDLEKLNHARQRGYDINIFNEVRTNNIITPDKIKGWTVKTASI